MFCKVVDCRFPGTHVSAGHQCGTCKCFGHGQYECSRGISQALRNSLIEVLPEHKRCRVSGCPTKKLHMTEAHVCVECGVRNGCEHISSDTFTTRCPTCRTDNSYKSVDEIKIFGIEQKCIVCQDKDIDVLLPQCRHACLCHTCISKIQLSPGDVYPFSDEEKEAIASAVRRFGDRDMVYVKEYAGQGCIWFIKKVRGTVSSFFLHGDNQGQYGEATNDVPLAMAFVAGCTEL